MEPVQESVSGKKGTSPSGRRWGLKLGACGLVVIGIGILSYHLILDNSYSVESSLLFVSGHEVAGKTAKWSISQEIHILKTPQVSFLLAEEIYVYTPKGDVKMLPVGSTALDFAFAIHSAIGTKCIGAKVHHKLVPISHKLRSGDQIEIITSGKQKPSEDWLNIVVTAKAKSKIKDSLREEKRKLRIKFQRFFGIIFFLQLLQFFVERCALRVEHRLLFQAVKKRRHTFLVKFPILDPDILRLTG